MTARESMSEADNVVSLDDFRGMRIARALERHFGLPRGAAQIDADFWAQRHDLIEFAKTGAPPENPRQS